MGKKILVVDDEKNIVDIVAFNLHKEGYDVAVARDGEAALLAFDKEKPDLVILDLMMPKMDGFETCRKIREKSQVPIIMLTARAEEVDKVLGLELGADDYVVKPFGVRELLARIKANLRRKAPPQTPRDSANLLVFGDITIDTGRYEIRRNNIPLDLTHREYELTKFLAMNNSQVFSREQLLEQVWGYDYYGDVRTVDVTVRRLRSKIEENSDSPKYILTRRGVGYYFSND
ncbi:MAG: response regulator transcription factor [Clostridiales bacterium]|jgi:two-component system response regulator VicR|nr:response regulator transcription factor [Clostridiales bacterium]